MRPNLFFSGCIAALAVFGALSAYAEPPQGPAGSPERSNWCYTKLLVCKQVTDANCNIDHTGLDASACKVRGEQNCEDSWGRGSTCLVAPARFVAPQLSARPKVLARPK